MILWKFGRKGLFRGLKELFLLWHVQKIKNCLENIWNFETSITLKTLSWAQGNPHLYPWARWVVGGKWKVGQIFHSVYYQNQSSSRLWYSYYLAYLVTQSFLQLPLLVGIIFEVTKKDQVANMRILQGAVHKLRHPIRGYGGVSQKMTPYDRGVGGGLAKDDRWQWWGRG